jgi:alkyl hydroperoxide reductase subunit F
MLDIAMKNQLKAVFAELNSYYLLDVVVDPAHESREELIELLEDVASCSDHISCRISEGEGLQFSLLKNEQSIGIYFRAVPNGHEFTSLLLAILNSDGKGKNLPDERTTSRIRALKDPIKLITYVSLTCTNCPEVVQALNIMAILNPQIIHKTVDQLLFSSGRTNFVHAAEKLLEKTADSAPGFRRTCQRNKISPGKQEKYRSVGYNHNDAPPR